MATMAATKHESSHDTARGVVYRTACQNRGCGCVFDLRITPETARLLSSPMACPRCKRHGGILKPQGRVGEKFFAAKLMFKLTGTTTENRVEDDDYFSEAAYRY